MKITDLRPDLSKPRVQCDMTTAEMGMEYAISHSAYRKDQSKRRGLELGRCAKTAKYDFDGRKLCAFHGGQEALKILLEQGKNEPVAS